MKLYIIHQKDILGQNKEYLSCLHFAYFQLL